MTKKKIYSQIFRKDNKAIYFCMIFIIWQLLTNVHEYIYLNARPYNKLEKALRTLHKKNGYISKLLRDSNETATKFALSTIIVALLSMCLLYALYSSKSRLLNFFKTKEFNLRQEIYGILFSTVVSSIITSNMSPILVLHSGAIFQIFIFNLYNLTFRRMLFCVCPYFDPTFCLAYDLYYLYKSNSILYGIHLPYEYTNISQKIRKIINDSGLNVRIYHGMYNFEFFTFSYFKENTIVLGPRDNGYTKQEMDGVLLHEINHVIDMTPLKKILIKTLSFFIVLLFKAIYLFRITNIKNNLRKWIYYTVYSFYIFTTIIYLLNLSEHYFLQDKEKLSDLFSKKHNGGRGLAQWLLKYNLERKIPITHTYMFNLTYYQHPTVEDRVYNLVTV